MYRKILSIFIVCAAVVLLFMTVVGGIPALTGIKAEVMSCAAEGNVTVSCDPASLSQPGEVTVSVTIVNINPAEGGSRDNITEANPTDQPAPSTGEPTDEPTPEQGAYTNINIANEYGVVFNTSDIPAGQSKTFTGKMNVSAEMMGIPLNFHVSWFDQSSGQTNARDITLTVTREDTVYLKLNRTASRRAAAPGETVTFTYTLSNTGTVTLNEIKLVDKDIAGSRAMLTPFTLHSGESREFQYSYVMRGVSVTSKPVVTFIPEDSDTAMSIKAPGLTVGLVNPQLTKEISRGEPTPEGVPFTMYFTNVGNKRLSGLTVTDELDNEIAKFNLAVGETKYIEYIVPNPDSVRNVVFKILGTDESGGTFRDNSQSFTVRPYIDPAALGLDFAVQIRSRLDADNMIGLIFTVTNTGSIDYSDIIVTEETLDYELYRIDKLAPGDGSVSSEPVMLNVGGERELVFILSAADTSGNIHTYKAQLNAEYYDPGAAFPNNPPTENDPSVIEDPQISAKLDKLLTAIGKKMASWFNILLVIAIIIACIVIVLLIAETVIRKKMKAQRQNRRRNG